jgi:hypothetical protein
MNTINTILIIVIILVLIFLIYNFLNNHFESFDNFSPYILNQAYPYVYEKAKDANMLRQTLKNWELPFNTHNEGYYNAEPNGNPPLVPIYSYVDKENVLFLSNSQVS